jgi:hypothetical protein
MPLRPEGTDTASSLGFRAAALTFLNRPAVVADACAGLRQMWEQRPENGRGGLTNSCARRRTAVESLINPVPSPPP